MCRDQQIPISTLVTTPREQSRNLSSAVYLQSLSVHDVLPKRVVRSIMFCKELRVAESRERELTLACASMAATYDFDSEQDRQ